jgi:poly-D-alanine transfer protein DltD
MGVALATLFFVVGMSHALRSRCPEISNVALRLVNLKNPEDFATLKCFANGSFGRGPIVFGSSELRNSNYSPEQWLPPRGISVVAVGHAHNQSLAILAQVAALGSKLSGKQVVVLVSPGWFSTGGTNPQAYAEFVPAHILRAITLNSHELPNDILDYLSVRHKSFLPQLAELPLAYHQFGTPATEAAQHFEDSARFVLEIFQQTVWPPSARSVAGTSPSAEFPSTVSAWENSYQRAKLFQESLSTNNKAGVYNEYFDKYLKNTSLPSALGAVAPAESNIEFQDFSHLVKIFYALGVKAQFVFIAFNPLVYSRLQPYIDISRRAEEVASQFGFPSLSLWDDIYQIGTMSDGMHVGPYGWLRINHFISGKESL